jgi:hypothetical protein
MIKECVAIGAKAKVIYQRLVTDKGYQGSYSSVQSLVAKLKDGKPRTNCPMTFVPGEAAQIGFGAGPVLIDP